MLTLTTKILILMFVLILTSSPYAQNETNTNEEQKPALTTELSSENQLPKNPTFVSLKKEIQLFLDFINKEAYAAIIDEQEEKKILRRKWEELLGVDVFYPYFKTKEIEDWVSEKVSVKFFNIKGKPKFEDNQIIYIFKVKF